MKCSAESFLESIVETAGHFVQETINSAELNSRTGQITPQTSRSEGNAHS